MTTVVVAAAIMCGIAVVAYFRPKPTRVTMHGSRDRGLLVGDTVLHGGNRYRVLKVDGTQVTWQKLGGTRLT